MGFPKVMFHAAIRQKLVLSLSFSLIVFGNAFAADLDYPPRVSREAPHDRLAAAPNPWCRIVPGPHHDLVGDTNSFQPMAVCYSAGVLADSYDYGDRVRRSQPSFTYEALKLFGIYLR